MWVFTTSGFVSAVQDWNDPRMLIVRARDAASLRPLAEYTATQIVASPTADYPYRLTISNSDFGDWVRAQATAIDYPNFKSEVTQTRGSHFAHALMGV